MRHDDKDVYLIRVLYARQATLPSQTRLTRLLRNPAASQLVESAPASIPCQVASTRTQHYENKTRTRSKRAQPNAVAMLNHDSTLIQRLPDGWWPSSHPLHSQP